MALCKLLLRRPDLLLLDEPTNHLDAESVAWMEDFLKGFPGTVVAITHDRWGTDESSTPVTAVGKQDMKNINGATRGHKKSTIF